MEQIRNFGDKRQLGWCIYCGAKTESRDHVPSKVFLDEPYPENLPVVPACSQCNYGFSLDEEYVACLIECVIAGAGGLIERTKIARILREKSRLQKKIRDSMRIIDSQIHFDVESDRVRNVILKLGRGHAAYELNEPQFEEPLSVSYSALGAMNEVVVKQFETPPVPDVFPEVGSRAMQRLFSHEEFSWIIVQPQRYRYLAACSQNEVIIRFVVREYLACEVRWA